MSKQQPEEEVRNSHTFALPCPLSLQEEEGDQEKLEGQVEGKYR